MKKLHRFKIYVHDEDEEGIDQGICIAVRTRFVSLENAEEAVEKCLKQLREGGTIEDIEIPKGVFVSDIELVKDSCVSPFIDDSEKY